MAKTSPSPTYPMFPEDAAAVTPSNSADLGQFSVIYVGVGGDVRVVTAQGSTVTFTGVPTGVTLPIRVRRVLSTGTTASSLVAIF